MNDAPFIPAWLDDRGLDPTAFRVLCHLWRRRNHRTGDCYPSAESIAKACGIGRKAVFKWIAELEKAELLTRAKTVFRGSNHYRLKVPIVPKKGTIGEPQSSPKRGHQSSPEEGRQSSPKRGHQGSPSEGSPIKGVCVSAEPLPPGPPHTPPFLSSVQADYPDKDVPGIWQKMLTEYASKPHRLTEHRLREWCKTEYDKPAARKKPSPVATASMLAQDGPADWRETDAYKTSMFAIVDGACHQSAWRGVSRECRKAVLSEMHYPADWDENPESRKVRWC